MSSLPAPYHFVLHKVLAGESQQATTLNQRNATIGTPRVLPKVAQHLNPKPLNERKAEIGTPISRFRK